MTNPDKQAERALIDALDRYLRQDETANDTDNGVYRQGMAAMSTALSHLSDAQKKEGDQAFAGLLFDFMGFLTTHETRWKFSAYDDATPGVQDLEQFAEKRGISLDDPDIAGWKAERAAHPKADSTEPAPLLFASTAQRKRHDAMVDRVVTTLDKIKADSTKPRACEYCNDSGDVTSIIGEWRGYCICPAGVALKGSPASAQVVEVHPDDAAVRNIGVPKAQPLTDEVEQYIVNRYQVVKTGHGFWPYCVKAVGGEMELFIGHKAKCEEVAAALQTACLDGAFIAIHGIVSSTKEGGNA